MRKPDAIASALPHNVEIERAILGAILLDNNPASRVIESLQAEDFYRCEHRKIFLHLESLRKTGKPTNDLVLLVDSLEESNELENAGGAAYVASIVDGLPKVQNVEHYAGILKRKKLQRQWIYSLQQGLELAFGNDSDGVFEALTAIRFPSSLGIKVETNRIQGFQSGEELAATVEKVVPWIVTGLVVKGAVTELCGKVKVGKSTFILDMVRAVIEGTPFLGYQTSKTTVLYLSEQPIASLRPAMERARLLGQRNFIVLQHYNTRGRSWPEVAAAAISECKRVESSLIVVDTLSQFAGLVGDAENNAGDALEAMLPLQHATGEGIGVIVNRHERKSGGEVGDSGRGSSAFAGAVDIVLSLRRSDGNAPKNRRLLQSLSRFTETPNDLLIEWSGSEYAALGERSETAIKEAKYSIFKNAPENEAEAVAVAELVKGLDLTRTTGYRAVEALVREGLLIRTGKGKRGDPHRFYSSQPQI